MGIEWSEELSTGDGEIDRQHKELFARVNVLLDACGTGRGRDEVGSLIGFLEDYVITHFATEELIMSRIGYAQCKDHKEEHELFIGQIGDIKKKFSQEGGGLNVVLLTVRTSIEWLTGHIKKSDRQLGAAMKKALPAGR